MRAAKMTFSWVAGRLDIILPNQSFVRFRKFIISDYVFDLQIYGMERGYTS